MEEIVIGDMTIFPSERRVELEGKDIRLTEQEWQILEILGLCAGSMVTRRMLLAVLHPRVRFKPALQSVDVAVHKARKKLKEASGGKNYIECVTGEGYVLRTPA